MTGFVPLNSRVSQHDRALTVTRTKNPCSCTWHLALGMVHQLAASCSYENLNKSPGSRDARCQTTCHLAGKAAFCGSFAFPLACFRILIPKTSESHQSLTHPRMCATVDPLPTLLRGTVPGIADQCSLWPLLRRKWVEVQTYQKSGTTLGR